MWCQISYPNSKGTWAICSNSLSSWRLHYTHFILFQQWEQQSFSRNLQSDISITEHHTIIGNYIQYYFTSLNYHEHWTTTLADHFQWIQLGQYHIPAPSCWILQTASNNTIPCFHDLYFQYQDHARCLLETFGVHLLYLSNIYYQVSWYITSGFLLNKEW